MYVFLLANVSSFLIDGKDFQDGGLVFVDILSEKQQEDVFVRIKPFSSSDIWC